MKWHLVSSAISEYNDTQVRLYLLSFFKYQYHSLMIVGNCCNVAKLQLSRDAVEDTRPTHILLSPPTHSVDGALSSDNIRPSVRLCVCLQHLHSAEGAAVSHDATVLSF